MQRALGALGALGASGSSWELFTLGACLGAFILGALEALLGALEALLGALGALWELSGSYFVTPPCYLFWFFLVLFHWSRRGTGSQLNAGIRK